MTSAIEADNLEFPAGFTERDLIYDRLQYEREDAPVYHDTKFCPAHRYELGHGWLTNKKQGKGVYGNCRWKDHKPQNAANKILNYQLSRELQERSGRKVPVGLPICRKCFDENLLGIEKDDARALAYFENEKQLLDTKLEPPPPPPRLPPPPLLQPLPNALMTPPALGRRIAGVHAIDKMQQMLLPAPGSGNSDQALSISSDGSPGYTLSQSRDRLAAFNSAMQTIAALSGRHWERLPFQLVISHK